MAQLTDNHGNRLRLKWFLGLSLSFHLPGWSLIALGTSLLVNLLLLSAQPASPTLPQRMEFPLVAGQVILS